jgi:hypothetical protein
MSRGDNPFGGVIAERRLQPRGARRRTVVVSLGKPRKTKGSEDWECPFRISGAGIRHVEYGRGIDAFQALTMALEGIRYFLDRASTPLVWAGVLDDHTGFQRVIPLLPERGGTQRIERVVDQEARRRLKQLQRRHRAGRSQHASRRPAPRGD